MPVLNVVRCLVVDDEPQAREVIKRYIEQVPILELAGETTNALDALRLLREQPVDLLFLDIDMPQLKGIDLIRILKDPPKVILTTAHAEYALESYELNVVDYLLKPIQLERFLKAVQKVIHTDGINVDSYTAMGKPDTKPFVYFRADRKMVKVLLDEILYIESMKDYIKVITIQGTVITKQSISSVEALLPESHFIRAHRSFIIALTHIRSYTGELVDIDGVEVPIGKLYRQSVLNALERFTAF